MPARWPRAASRVAVVERELVGGECSYWACIPSKTLLRPGEAVQGAREAAATAEVDVAAALAWRDFMVSELLRRRRPAQWLADRKHRPDPGQRPAGRAGVVEVEGVRYTAQDVVVANGADPFVPPVPGLRELDGVWTNREATGMKEVPPGCWSSVPGRPAWSWRRCRAASGREVVVVEGAAHVLAREPGAAGRGARREPAP